MHKCFKCGTEFEGAFCPECGTQWQEQKYCPQCWAMLAGSAKFCNNCGYSFVEETEKKKAKKHKGENKFFKWIKKHLKAVIALSCVLVVVIVMLSLIPTFSAMSVNGTYFYTASDGTPSESNYITLSTGKWKNSNGVEGKYSYSLGKITMKYEDKAMKELGELLGQDVDATVELSGTIKNGVLTVTDGKREQIYVSKKHKHEFGEWEIIYEPTCTVEGEQRQVCACKKFETNTILPTGHTINDDYLCTVCELQFTKELIYEYHRYTYDSEGEYSVTGFTDEPNDVVILDYYEGKPVTSIGRYAFQSCESLTSITIPSSVTSIGDYAFEGCSGLEYIYYMGDIAGWCKISGLGNLMCGEDERYGFGEGDEGDEGSEEWEEPDEGEYGDGEETDKLMNKKLFINNQEIKGTLVIPDSVTKIKGSAFRGCNRLTSITIPNSVTDIESSAFRGCSGLTSVTIPDSVTSIEEYAFAYCSGLTSITIPDKMTNIRGSMFYGCNRLIQTENGVQYVGKWVIDCNTSVTSVTLRTDTVGIADNAFEYCSQLTSITIPNSVTNIGKDAFRGCYKLIQTENGVQYVGKWVIDCNTSVTSVTLRADTVRILDRAFEDCNKLTSITIPNSVTSIGKDAFCGCYGLTSITFEGTKKEWNEVKKSSNWNSYTGNYTIQCTDGKLDRNGNEIG